MAVPVVAAKEFVAGPRVIQAQFVSWNIGRLIDDEGWLHSKKIRRWFVIGCILSNWRFNLSFARLPTSSWIFVLCRNSARLGLRCVHCGKWCAFWRNGTSKMNLWYHDSSWNGKGHGRRQRWKSNSSFFSGRHWPQQRQRMQSDVPRSCRTVHSQV